MEKICSWCLRLISNSKCIFPRWCKACLESNGVWIQPNFSLVVKLGHNQWISLCSRLWDHDVPILYDNSVGTKVVYPQICHFCSLIMSFCNPQDSNYWLILMWNVVSFWCPGFILLSFINNPISGFFHHWLVVTW